MQVPDLRERLRHEGKSFRNIATIKTSQNLFDDLVDEADADGLRAVQHWADETSGVDHKTDQKLRPFQYAEQDHTLSEFDTDNWYETRFSDGTFGVWYGALEKETSITEALYWQFRKVYKPMLGGTKEPIVVDRLMLEAEVQTEVAFDLRPFETSHPLLVHDSDYSLCQRLGAKATSLGIDLYLTPSARKKGGVCTPIFAPRAIRSTKKLYYLHFEFRLDGTIRITTDHDEIIPVPIGW